MDIDQLIRGLGAHIGGARRAASRDPIARYTTLLLGHASRWAMFAATGMVCTIHHRVNGRTSTCGSPAIGQCVICRMPACLEHSMVSARDGTLICFACVGRAVERESHRQGAAAPPPAEPASQPGTADGPGWWGIPPSDDEDLGEREQRLLVLGLSGEPSDEEIKAAYRRLAKESHPDRYPEGAPKLRAEQRMRRINEAYSWLMGHRRAA